MSGNIKLSCMFLEEDQTCNAGFHEGNPTPGDCLACTQKVWCSVIDGRKVFDQTVDKDYEKKAAEIRSRGLRRAVNELESRQEQQSADVSRGLGDTIAKATKAVGIKPCGACKKRQALLNKMVPYKPKDKNAKDSSANPPNNGETAT